MFSLCGKYTIHYTKFFHKNTLSIWYYIFFQYLHFKMLYCLLNYTIICNYVSFVYLQYAKVTNVYHFFLFIRKSNIVWFRVTNLFRTLEIKVNHPKMHDSIKFSTFKRRIECGFNKEWALHVGANYPLKAQLVID